MVDPIRDVKNPFAMSATLTGVIFMERSMPTIASIDKANRNA
jgi:hypothetical protein